MRALVASALAVIVLSSFALAQPTVGLPAQMTAVEGQEDLVGAVSTYLATLAPEVSQEDREAAAVRFLGELRSTQPAFGGSVSIAELSLSQRESQLLKALARELKPSAGDAVRDQLAVKRVQAILGAEGLEPASLTEAARLVAQMQATSAVYHRRLRDGRMEDEDLASMIRKLKAGPVSTKRVAEQKEDTAAAILAEFSRKNQQGASVARLKAYVVECELTTSAGIVQRLVIARQRPDRFRLHVYEGTELKLVLAGNLQTLIRLPRDGKLSRSAQSDATAAEFLARFVDPLLEPEQLLAVRETDDKVGGRDAFRIKVQDSPVAAVSTVWIDKAEHRLLMRENADGTRMVYTDFKEEAGVTWPHRIETSDQRGRSSVLRILRLTANPGLVSDLFEISEVPAFDVFDLESTLAIARASNVATNP